MTDSPNAGENWEWCLDPPTDPGFIGRIGEFDINGKIAQGSYGTVFRATDASRQAVAVKVLHKHHLAPSNESRKRFEREIELLAKYRPKCLPTFHRNDLSRGCPYFVMELLDGWTLQQFAESHPFLSELEIIRIGIELAESIAELHGFGIYHRDLDPTNAFVCRVGQAVRLLDLGCARDPASTGSMTRGQPLGHWRTVDPWFAHGPATGRLDERTDLYSVGAILFFLWTGLYLFEDYLSLKKAVDGIPPPPLIRPQPHQDPPLQEFGDLILRLLGEPDLRPANGRELASTLRVIGSQCLGATSATPLLPAIAASTAASSIELLPDSDLRGQAIDLAGITIGELPAREDARAVEIIGVATLICAGQELQFAIEQLRADVSRWRTSSLPTHYLPGQEALGNLADVTRLFLARTQRIRTLALSVPALGEYLRALDRACRFFTEQTRDLLESKGPRDGNLRRTARIAIAIEGRGVQPEPASRLEHGLLTIFNELGSWIASIQVRLASAAAE